MSDVNDKIICSSWLMFYLRSKNDDECITTVVKLGYIMLTKNIDHITVAARQESNISKKSQIIVLRYLSNCFGTRLIVPKYCIDKLGQNHVIPQCDFFSFRRETFHFETKPITKILTTSIQSLYCQEYSNEPECNDIPIIDTVVSGDYGQEKFRSVCKFILREMNENTWISM